MPWALMTGKLLSKPKIKKNSNSNDAVVFVLETVDGEFEVRKDTAAVLNGELQTFPGGHVITFQSFENEVYITDK